MYTLKQNYVQRKSFNNNSGLFTKKRPILSHLDIELTERCNNNCIHCYINLLANDKKAIQRELSTEQWMNVIKQAADLGALSIRFTGGEPLLRSDFETLYNFSRRLGLKVVLFTNARLITKPLVDLFSRIPPLIPIEISVYGMRTKTYESITNSFNAFYEFRKGIDLLIEKDIPFMVKSVLLPPNKGEQKEYEAWIENLPGSQKPSYSVFLDLRARRDSLKKNRNIVNLRFSPSEAIELIAEQKKDHTSGMVKFVPEFLYPQGAELFNCGAGTNGCVDAYGQYQMCMLLRHPDMVYDLTTGTLKEGLLDVFPRLRQAKASNPDYLRRCARCFLKGLCEQCPAKSWMEHGTLDTPVEYLCQVAHAQARFLGLLEEDEHAWEVDDWQARIRRFVAQEHKPVQQTEPENLPKLGDS